MIPINIVAITCIFLIVRNSANSTVQDLTNQHTKSLLSSAMLTIKNQYTSLQFQRLYTTEMRKMERQQIVKIAKSILNQYYHDSRMGKLSEAEAKQMALERVKAFRYDDGNGYIWINDTSKLIPGIIMHPIYSQFNGKKADDPIFYTSEDSINVTRLAVDICEKHGAGYIEYMWRKPRDSASMVVPKISYVELFEPWQWVLGTGIYLEDIEEDVANRLSAINDELKQTMGKMQLGKTGYFFIFNSDKKFVLHPLYSESTSDSLYATLPVNVPFEAIMKAAHAEQNSHEYTWYSPHENELDNPQRKKIFVEYFKPLDWYVCASFYHAELEEPGMMLGRKILYISAIFIVISILAMLNLSLRISKPLNELTGFVAGIPEKFEQIDIERIPEFRSHEAKSLGQVIKDMLTSIKHQQKSLLEEKGRAQESEEKMRDNEKKFRTLYESSSDAIFLIQDKRIVSCNQRTLQLLKRKKEDVIGSMPHKLSPTYQENGQRSADMTEEILASVLAGESRVFEWQHSRPDGEIVDCSVSLNLVELNNEKYVQATARDMSEHKKNEKELAQYRSELEKLVETRTEELNQANVTLSMTNDELVEKNDLIVHQNSVLKETLQNLKETQGQLIEAEKMASLGILTAGVAHEINNPINYIQNGTLALKMLFDENSSSDSKKHNQLFEAVFTGVKRITEIVRSLGKYSWSQKGVVAPCNIQIVVDNCLTILSNKYKHTIEVRKLYLQNIPLVDANEGELHQVFLNILSNAVQAIPEKGNIEIEVSESVKQLQVRISDDGIGIKPECKGQIFDPFYTTKEPGKGTGLGLSIAKKLIENQGGQIEVHSVFGKGSTFIVSLPIKNYSS